MTRSRSRWNAGRIGSSGSGCTRPRLASLFDAWGARIWCSRASSSWRMDSFSNRPLAIRPTSNAQSPTSSLKNIAKEARAVRQGSDAEDLRDGLPQIRERLPHADVGPGPAGRPHEEDRYVLRRTVRARRRRIVSVVSRRDEQSARAEPRQQPPEPLVEALQVRGVAGRIVAVAVLRVEIDEVREHESRTGGVDRFLDLVHSLFVAFRVDGGRDAAPGEQVLNLPYGVHRAPRGRARFERRQA